MARDGPAPFTVVETGKGYDKLQSAIDAIGSGKGTIAVAPGRFTQCAVQGAGDISYLATEPGSAVFDGVACEGKGALVLRGRSAEVSGLVFENIRVPDFNGAGIRLEHGDLTVAQSWFRDSQQGILTGGDPNGLLVVDRSTFTRLGTCEGAGGCAHSIYTGEYGQVRITRSRFEEGRGGHYVKSRAAHVDIASCSFDDVHGKGTNYMIDLPEGRDRADQQQLVRPGPRQGQLLGVHRRRRRGQGTSERRVVDPRQRCPLRARRQPQQRLRGRLVGRSAEHRRQPARHRTKALRAALSRNPFCVPSVDRAGAMTWPADGRATARFRIRSTTP